MKITKKKDNLNKRDDLKNEDDIKNEDDKIFVGRIYPSQGYHM